MRIATVGGDARTEHIATALRAVGHEVTVSAYGELPLSPTALAEAEAVLLPHPLSRDGTHLNAPLSPLPVPLDSLFALLPEGCRILCGRTDGPVAALASRHRLLAYAMEEEYLARNAAITAEGALFLLMSRLSVTLSETPCLILGSGRLARALHALLVGLRAPVTVFARRTDPWSPHMTILPLTALPAEIGRFPVLINTVPVRLLTPALLDRAAHGATLLELSAVPEVMDSEEVRRAGLEPITAPALPGRYAPVSAGRAIADAANRLLSKL